jgi:tetratricopeptide (TPR) repeat protein
MWGGNLLSTFAGEFSYSLSFGLSLILIGSLYRGCQDNRRVILNAFLVFLVGFSHGYTLLFVEALSVFFLVTPDKFVQRAVYLFKVYALGFCFLAFWLVPLLVYTRYTTSYHTIWRITSWRLILPAVMWPFAVFAAGATAVLLVRALRRKAPDPARTATALACLWFGVAVSAWMFLAAPKLGVVDIRYVAYGQILVCLLPAVGLGALGARWRARRLDLALCLLVVPAILTWTAYYVDVAPSWEEDRVGLPAGWAKWNYEGFEAKAAWPTFRAINAALQGDFEDPRVVFEHAADKNNRFGSSRAFESLPFFAGRATLEGLYMQASISAPFVFYIQSETSSKPSSPFPQYAYSSLDFNRARARLDMFNARELILASHHAKRSIRSAEGYALDDTIGDYEIWRRTGGPGRYVTPLEYEPVLLETDNWKAASHLWFTHDELLDVHLVFSSMTPEGDRDRFPVRAAELEDIRRVPVDTTGCEIEETIPNREIVIRTNWIGKPLLVRMSYHPNWHVEGAERIYLVSPSFMLVYPEEETVRLTYRDRAPERLGKVLTVLGLLIVLLAVPLPWKRGRSGWSLLAARLGVPESLEPKLPWRLSARTRRRILCAVVAGVLIGGAVAGFHIYWTEPQRVFNRGIRLKDAKQYAAARDCFQHVIQEARSTTLAEDSAYYIAATYYLEGRNRESIEAWDFLIRTWPKSRWAAQGHYHIGICLFRLGREQQAIERLRMLRREYPSDPYAENAADRLREHNAL